MRMTTTTILNYSSPTGQSEATTLIQSYGSSQSTSTLLLTSDDCVIIPVNVTTPWDNPHGSVSMQSEYLFEKVKSVILVPALYVIGAPTNVINMVVFRQQGLRERINLCLFLLALVDALFITVIFVQFVERLDQDFLSGERYPIIVRYMINHNVIGLYGLGPASAFLTSVVAAERCLCVLWPLRAYGCVSVRHFAAGLLGGVVLLTALRFLGTAQYQVRCFFQLASGRLTWQLAASSYRVSHALLLKVLDGVFFGLVISLGCPLVVLVASILTALKLRKIVRWRVKSIASLSLSAWTPPAPSSLMSSSSTSLPSTTSSSSSSSSSSSASVWSSREAGVTRMLLSLSCEFLLLSIPVVALRLSVLLFPDVSPEGSNVNLLRLLIGLTELSQYVSCSLNFFVYYATGSRFRRTLRALVRGRPRDGAGRQGVPGSRSRQNHERPSWLSQREPTGAAAVDSKNQ